MAFTGNRSRSRKCPVCLTCTATKLAEVNQHLAPLLADIKEHGDVPKVGDKRFQPIAHAVGISPHSLRYHLKSCLLDLEIQDQRLLELKDLTAAINTAKNEYLGNPSMANATAYTSLMNVFRGLAEDIEGQQDPETTVQYVVETALGPMARQTLAAATQELRTLRDSITTLVPRNHASYVKSQVDATLQRLSTALRQSLDDGLKNVCGYYKVELEAKSRKLALETNTSLDPARESSFEPLPDDTGTTTLPH